MPHDGEPHVVRAPGRHGLSLHTEAPEAPEGPIAVGAAARRDADRGTCVDAHLVRLDDALRAAAARVYAGDPTPDPALHAAVCAAVDALRADGADVLATLRAVKGRLAAARPQGLCDAAVRWCIARYYDPAARAAPERPV